MIRSLSDYRQAVKNVEAGRRNLVAHEAKLRDLGFKPEEVDCFMGPVLHFQGRLEAEVERFEQLRRGELETDWALEDLGRLLVEARIARGLTQRSLAKKLGVDESMVSRDERNEYYGISAERARLVLEALGVKARLRVEMPAKVVRHVAAYALPSFKARTRQTTVINNAGGLGLVPGGDSPEAAA